MSFALLFEGVRIQLTHVPAAMTIPRTKSMGWTVLRVLAFRPRALLGPMILVVLMITSEDRCYAAIILTYFCYLLMKHVFDLSKFAYQPFIKRCSPSLISSFCCKHMSLYMFPASCTSNVQFYLLSIIGISACSS